MRTNDTLEALITQLKVQPELVEFKDVIAVIDQHFHYTPTCFHNGLGSDKFTNEAGSNEGSCKIFAFGLENSLSEAATLHCFGRYYREDVLKHPDNSDHANIRNFIKYGWKGLEFEGSALVTRGA